MTGEKSEQRSESLRTETERTSGTGGCEMGMGATEGTRGLIRDFRVFFFSNVPPAVGSDSLLVMNGWI
jgi:hypothetical protein